MAPSRPRTATRTVTLTARGETGSRTAPGLVRLSAIVTGIGGTTILVCVTLLKYFHELVEASRAVVR
jgi:hypothetical protein